MSKGYEKRQADKYEQRRKGKSPMSTAAVTPVADNRKYEDGKKWGDFRVVIRLGSMYIYWDVDNERPITFPMYETEFSQWYQGQGLEKKVKVADRLKRCAAFPELPYGVSASMPSKESCARWIEQRLTSWATFEKTTISELLSRIDSGLHYREFAKDFVAIVDECPFCGMNTYQSDDGQMSHCDANGSAECPTTEE